MRATFVLILILAGPVYGHKPFFSEGQYQSADAAWPIEDIDISIVMYHHVTCDAQQLWLSFDAVSDEALYVQLGVPVIDRLVDYRPSVALLAPGLPALDGSLPFSVPDGLGGYILHSSGRDEPDSFYEPFTQTESWIWVEGTHQLPHEGRGYLVAWHPEGLTGKLWLAVGTVEDFSDASVEDFAGWRPKTRGFHELDPTDAQSASDPHQCAVPDPEASGRDSGCAASSVAPLGEGLMTLIFIVGVFLFRSRRKAPKGFLH